MAKRYSGYIIILGVWPCCPSPRLAKIDAAFVFTCTWRSMMVSYVGSSMIRSTVGWGKPAVVLFISIVGILLSKISNDYY